MISTKSQAQVVGESDAQDDGLQGRQHRGFLRRCPDVREPQLQALQRGEPIQGLEALQPEWIGVSQSGLHVVLSDDEPLERLSEGSEEREEGGRDSSTEADVEVRQVGTVLADKVDKAERQGRVVPEKNERNCVRVLGQEISQVMKTGVLVGMTPSDVSRLRHLTRVLVVFLVVVKGVVINVELEEDSVDAL